MSDQTNPTPEQRAAYVADMLIDLAILLRGGTPTPEPSDDGEPVASA